jgi:hypothetical protein
MFDVNFEMESDNGLVPDIGLNIELRIGMDLDIGTELNADSELTLPGQHSNLFTQNSTLDDCYTGDN